MTIAVLATDGSANSVAAARRMLDPGLFAGTLAVHLVHVTPEITGRPRAWFSKDVLDQWLEEAATQAFGDILPIFLHAGIQVTEHRRYGEPATQICEVADAAGADVIVMGTHGRGAFFAAVMGSVASHVVATARVPVLLVPRNANAG